MNISKRILPADRRPQDAQNALTGKRQMPPQNRRINSAGQSSYTKRPSDGQKPRTVKNMSAQPRNKSAPYGTPTQKNRPVKLRMQTVNTVNKKQIKVRRKLTPEEIAAQKRMREAYLRKQKIYKIKLRDYKLKLFKEWLRVFLCRLMVFSVMFVLFFLITTMFFFVNLLNNGSPDTGVYNIQTGSEYDLIAVKAVKGNLLFRNGAYYINVTDIASYCEFTTTGDMTQMRFISKGENNDNVRFKIGDAVIFVNGVRARLSAPIIGEGDSIYVPVEFFNKYALGITVNVDTAGRKITVSRTFDEATSTIISEFEVENLLRKSKGQAQKAVSELAVDIGYEDIKFTLRRDEPTEHIDENSIGSDLLVITDPAYIASQKALAEGTATQTNGAVLN